MALVEVVSVFKSFGGAMALRDVSFRVEKEETVCLLGPRRQIVSPASTWNDTDCRTAA